MVGRTEAARFSISTSMAQASVSMLVALRLVVVDVLDLVVVGVGRTHSPPEHVAPALQQ